MTRFDPTWLADHVAPFAMGAWRGVEDQHVASTMRLVDNFEEQDVLEQLLESSKPALPPLPAGQHYLLFTPFRYRPPFGSRFRQGGTVGVWYGAQSVQTAAAEVAYWRWRFLMDSPGLIQDTLITHHTFFHAKVAGQCVNLLTPPWSDLQDTWTDPMDYTETQRLAQAAMAHDVDWIRYASVRDPGGLCAAVLSPQALSMAKAPSLQKWLCKVTRERVMMSSDEHQLMWDF